MKKITAGRNVRVGTLEERPLPVFAGAREAAGGGFGSGHGKLGG